MKKKKRRKMDRHHIIPRSKSGQDNPVNIVRIDARLHNDYHRLFSDRTPIEIIHFLVEYFWGGNSAYLYEALAEKELERR